MSTGTLAADFNAVCNASGICPYFLNQFSARARSPVASISSNSFARLATAAGIFAVLTVAQALVLPARKVEPSGSGVLGDWREVLGNRAFLAFSFAMAALCLHLVDGPLRKWSKGPAAALRGAS